MASLVCLLPCLSPSVSFLVCFSSASELPLLPHYYFLYILPSPFSPSIFNQQLPPSPTCRYVGPYTTLSPELSFVVEDSEGVCGYVLAALDSSQFYDGFLNDWLPTIIGKYPKPSAGEEKLNPEQVSKLAIIISVVD